MATKSRIRTGLPCRGTLAGETHTVALFNAQTYSYDCLDGLLRTILIRSAPYARHNPNQVQVDGPNAWQDQGRQERTFWLVRGKGNHSAMNLDRRALELQLGAEYVLDSRHAGTYPWEQSFMDVTPSHIEVLAIKWAEEGHATIIRLQERSGEHTTAHIHSSALKINTDVQLSPWEIKTISITEHANGQTKTLSIVEL